MLLQKKIISIFLRSKDENIELVPVEEFLKEAPESITKPFKNVCITFNVL